MYYHNDHEGKKNCVDSHAGYKRPKKKLRVGAQKERKVPDPHESSSSSLSASSSKPP
jgi:hypothetical protein